MNSKHHVHSLVVTLVLVAASGPASAADSQSEPTTRAVNTPDSSRPANSLAARVEQHLRAHLPVAGATINVTEQQGTVTLGGWVDAYVKRGVAQELAESVPGVSAVVNQIRTQPVTGRSDEQIAENVRASLQSDLATRSLDIGVSVRDGVVRLSGDVQAEPQRRVVGWMASRLLGVRDVLNQIQVNPEPRSDEAIQEELQEHFAGSAVFNENDISVQVKDGVAKLAGTVDNVREKTWAQTDAWVPGVRRVDGSELKAHFDPNGWRRNPVTAGPVSDEQIRRMIKRQYVYDPRVYSFKPGVEVQDGVVTLSGEVSYRSAKRAAVEITRHVGGVKEVLDRLEVRPASSQKDEDIAAAVRATLDMHSLVDADDIEVKVNEGAVVLTGTVLDPLARWTAEDLADRTSGVVAVENNLRAAHEPLPGVAQYHFPRGYAFQPTFPAVSPLTPTIEGDLASAVRTQLAFSPFTDLTQVRVSARNDVVTLEGEVESHVARQAAADHAFQAGAKDVINRLRVAGASE